MYYFTNPNKFTNPNGNFLSWNTSVRISEGVLYQKDLSSFDASKIDDLLRAHQLNLWYFLNIIRVYILIYVVTIN